jgi:hypothetical protein
LRVDVVEFRTTKATNCKFEHLEKKTALRPTQAAVAFVCPWTNSKDRAKEFGYDEVRERLSIYLENTGRPTLVLSSRGTVCRDLE